MIKSGCRRTSGSRGDGEKEFTPGMVIKTTAGRVIFNDILHPKMPYYNLALGRSSSRGSSPTATSSSADARRSSCSTT